MIRTFTFTVMLVSFISIAEAQTINAIPALIPYPKEINIEKGNFQLTTGLLIVNEKRDAEIDSITRWFSDVCFQRSGIKLKIKPNNGAKPGIILNLTDDKSIGNEGYRMKVSAEIIEIEAFQPAGIFYAYQTLLQFIPVQKMRSVAIPCMKISDQPSFVWRGMLLDCGRSFMDKDFVKRYIDLLAMLKMNRFHWHLTEDQGWRIEIKKYPRLTEIGAWRTLSDGTRYGGFYTQDEIKEVVEYARQRFITVIPEIELPGHCQAALASYPGLSCTGGPFEVETRWGVFKDIYCAGNDSVLIFLKNVFDEVMQLFPSPYIHIGGDEVPKFRWENCAKCQQRIRDNHLKDEHELQSWFIGQINDYLKAHGRKLIGWDEILEGGLVSGATVQSWRGFEGAMHAARAGSDAIVSPTSHAYLDYDIGTTNLERVYSFDPVPFGLEPELQKHILGGECNLWSERAPQELVDGRVFPRILAMSEVLWTYPKERDFAAFKARTKSFYPLLDGLGVKYGYEKQPVAFQVRSNYADKKINVELVKGMEDAELHYTLDGSEPTIKSKKVEGSFSISEKANLSVGAFLNGRGSPEVFTRQFEIHKAFGITPEYANTFSPNYAASGFGSLTDGQRGTIQFRDNLWLGFEGADFVAQLDLGSIQEINNISIGFLQSVPSWIFYPEYVKVLVSENGKDYIEKTTVNFISWKDEKTTTQDFNFKLNVKARYIKVQAVNIGKCPDWHPGAGGKTWLFVDEIVVR
jgi:hexosaminidase